LKDAYSLVEAGNPVGEDPLEAIKNGKARFEGGLPPLSTRLKTGIGYVILAVFHSLPQMYG